MKILQLATFPIVEPRHGGQLRTRHIYDEYRKAGIDVDFVGIFPQGAYSQHASSDLQLPGDLAGRVLREYEHPVYDYIWGTHIASLPVARDALLARIRQATYDFIQIDHICAWPLARECLSILRPGEAKPRIIYSAHNIEHEMRRQVLRELRAPSAAIEQYGDAVLALEREVATRATHAFAVSTVDRNFINSVGRRNDCVQAKNGTAYSTVPEIATEDWRPVLPRDPFAVFISSGHLPNAVGFSAALGDSLAFLPPDRKLVIAGGVTPVIERTEPYRRWAAINNSRTLRLGVVDDIGIAAMRRFAHVFVLPITAGGGSNIKTAEALLTGAHVLATPTAFRGFEEYIDEPAVHVEADPDRFRKKLVALLEGERAQLTEAEQAVRKRLLWESTLSPMISKLLSLEESSPNAQGTAGLV
ncbi:hypothetical protein [Variovorax sp.]|uniref:hypothetical protein n=1 Tax=Variovorax sp. TaxID=1871043 RepID=UPI002D67652B|nr:hypothetical protein [Variovorax sp.]HYP82107.1 hypothetical protein [Variovorax sp.]